MGGDRILHPGHIGSFKLSATNKTAHQIHFVKPKNKKPGQTIQRQIRTSRITKLRALTVTVTLVYSSLQTNNISKYQQKTNQKKGNKIKSNLTRFDPLCNRIPPVVCLVIG